MVDSKEIAVLNNKLQHIDESIGDINRNVNAILEKINKQNGDLIKAEKDIEYLSKELDETKKEHEKEIETLWNELRRRDKKVMWIIGLVVTITMGLMAFIATYLAK
jgi:chromosome segregation ATPase